MDSPFLTGAVAKADDRHRRAGLRRRAHAALHPPSVARAGVDSSAIRSMGYQRQTRRMAVEMNSRPGHPYSYRMRPREAQAFVEAKSKGAHYAREVRGKHTREPRVRLRDRARLFADPNTDDGMRRVSKIANPFVSKALDSSVFQAADSTFDAARTVKRSVTPQPKAPSVRTAVLQPVKSAAQSQAAAVTSSAPPVSMLPAIGETTNPFGVGS